MNIVLSNIVEETTIFGFILCEFIVFIVIRCVSVCDTFVIRVVCTLQQHAMTEYEVNLQNFTKWSSTSQH